MKPLPEMTFPTRPIPARFVPDHGSHHGNSERPKELCVMEALNWAQGENKNSDSPSCVSRDLSDVFINLNDEYGDAMRKALFKRVHRLVGTNHLPSKVISCLTDTINTTTSQRTILKQIDKILDDIDSWCAQNNPLLAALRAEVPPLWRIPPTRAKYLKKLQEITSSGAVSSLPSHLLGFAEKGAQNASS